MLALPGILLLVAVEYLRPWEYSQALRSIPLLYIAAAQSTVGLALDLRMRLARLRAAPHFLLVVLFFAWCIVTVVVRAPGQVPSRSLALAVPLAVYLLVGHGVQGFRNLQIVCGLLLAIGLTLASIGVHQALADPRCHRVAVSASGEMRWLNDGRPCQSVLECEGEGAEPGSDYTCERAGLFGTSSITGRVRFLGTLEDPNELALVVAICVPFALAFFDRRRTFWRGFLLAATVLLVGTCTLFTQSRGGQLVFLTVFGVYFVRRVGLARGIAVGLALALPILLFGGRSGGGAEASTVERSECWWVGLHLLQASPVFGVGAGQFMEHHFLTAHNSFILAGAELGLPGLFLWVAVMYLCVKIPLQALRADVAPVARSWALAILASFAGLLVGITFLSFAYKDVLWIFVALTGMLHEAVQHHDPSFRVRFGKRDALLTGLIVLSLLFAFVAFTFVKVGGW